MSLFNLGLGYKKVQGEVQAFSYLRAQAEKNLLKKAQGLKNDEAFKYFKPRDFFFDSYHAQTPVAFGIRQNAKKSTKDDAVKSELKLPQEVRGDLPIRVSLLNPEALQGLSHVEVFSLEEAITRGWIVSTELEHGFDLFEDLNLTELGLWGFYVKFKKSFNADCCIEFYLPDSSRFEAIRVEGAFGHGQFAPKEALIETQERDVSEGRSLIQPRIYLELEEDSKVQVFLNLSGEMVIEPSVGNENAFTVTKNKDPEQTESQIFEFKDVANGSLKNITVRAKINPRAHLEFTTLQNENQENICMTRICAEVGDGAVFNNLSFALGGKASRLDSRAEVVGSQAQVYLKGVSYSKGQELMSHNSEMLFKAPSSFGEQNYKCILTGHSRTVFSGRIEIATNASGTDASQLNQNLLLSEGCEIDTKPLLNILTDDVKAKHGATVGQLNEEEIFYLRSRGLALKESRSLLIEGFFLDFIEQIRNKSVRNWIKKAFKHSIEF